jgi:hypothetical protein
LADGARVAPCFYFTEKAFDTDDEEEVARQLAEAYRELPPIGETAMENLAENLNKDFILERVVPQVVRYDDNPIVEGKARKQVLDLAVLYRVVLNENESFLLNDDVRYNLGISITELDRAAMQNLEKNAVVTPLSKWLTGKSYPEDCVLLLTNEDNYYGASTMLSENVLEAVCRHYGGDFYVMVSSVHDAICVPYVEGSDVNNLRSIVFGANRELVPTMEIVTDTVYRYDSEAKRLKIA